MKLKWTVSSGIFIAMGLIRVAASDLPELISARAATAEVTSVGGGDSYGPVATPDGKFVVSTSSDGTIRYWELATGRQVHCWVQPEEKAVHALALSPDGTTLASVGGDGIVRLSDATTRKEIKRVNVGGGAAGIQMSADGARAFAAVGSRNGVAIIDVKTLEVSGFIATGPGPDGLAWVAGG